jgi:hypothetical protein
MLDKEKALDAITQMVLNAKEMRMGSSCPDSCQYSKKVCSMHCVTMLDVMLDYGAIQKSDVDQWYYRYTRQAAR